MLSPIPTLSEFEARVEAHRVALRKNIELLFGAKYDVEEIVSQLLMVAEEAYHARPQSLKNLDSFRSENPYWYKSSNMVGYSTYVDRFGGDLKGVEKHADHLEDLGVTYLHLLPLLDMRPGLNDGGFAVQSYDRPDPRFGTIQDLSNLAATLRERRISLCIDLVCNHTSDTHEWALKAKQGDEFYKEFYHFYPDREIPDQYEKTVAEIFSETAPGNFTYVDEVDEWVWTTFYGYQWDLNYSNPNVLTSMAEKILNLANHGVEIFRLDAVPFMWKRMGTKCQGEPEVHAVLRCLRAITEIAAPSVLLKAEAIAPSEEIVVYVGGGEEGQPECHLAYNAVFMTQLWAALAKGNVEPLRHVMSKMPAMPSGSVWLAYGRCHDDIQWSPLSGEQAIKGIVENWDVYAREAAAFLQGEVENSFAEGKPFQTGDGPNDVLVGTSGTMASLCGLGKALREGNEAEIELSIDRIILMYSVLCSFGGIPLINMGDEIGMLNDEHFASRESYDGDGRWVHRGLFDWDLINNLEESPVGRIYRGIKHAIACRKSLDIDASAVDFIDVKNSAVLATCRSNADRVFLFLANMTAEEQSIELPQGTWRDLTRTESLASKINFAPYQVFWLVSE